MENKQQDIIRGLTLNSATKNMARTSVYGAGTKSDAMSIEYKEYILELNATTFEVWTGDRKYRLTSSRYGQKHDGGALAQTVVRLLKKRSIWAGGENLKGITIVTKYRNNVPEEIVDSIDEALSMEGFKVNPINKPKHGVENRARNRRIRNAQEMLGNPGYSPRVVLIPNSWILVVTDNDKQLVNTEVDDLTEVERILDEANADYGYSIGIDLQSLEEKAMAEIEFPVVDVDLSDYGEQNKAPKRNVAADPWKNRQSFSLKLNQG